MVSLTPADEIENDSDLSSSDIQALRDKARDEINNPDSSDATIDVLSSGGTHILDKSVEDADSGNEIVVWPNQVESFVSDAGVDDEDAAAQYFHAGGGVGFIVD